MLSEKKLKSISVFVPEEIVLSSLEKSGFVLQETATVSNDGKFWKKALYIKGDELISVSEELGDYWPKDPIVSIYGLPNTIQKILGDIDAFL